MKHQIPDMIRHTLEGMMTENKRASETLTDRAELTDYAHLVRPCPQGEVWTDALQKALDEHEIIHVPPRELPYFIDDTVTVPSHRRIEAHGATLKLTQGCRVLMLRNRHTVDGTHAPVTGERDENITILGGRFGESMNRRAGYGKTGRYVSPDCPEPRPFFGVSTCFLFNNMDGLTLQDVTFFHTAGFSVQMGDITRVVCDNIHFDSCYADGLHTNGNSELLFFRNIRGEVGDDLVALNMYDWQNSSVNFGPTRTVWCENLELAPTSRYKALRIEPGVYTYDDGTRVDCGLFDAVFQNVRGIATYKLYFQTPRYPIGTDPEPGAVGSVDNLFFRDITVHLDHPVDPFPAYLESDPVRGHFAAFELGANVGYLSFENIRLTLLEKYPLSHLVTVGPKSIRDGQYEIFDPFLSSTVDTLEFRNVLVNGVPPTSPAQLFHVTSFNDVNLDGRSTGQGTLHHVIWDNKTLF